MERMRIILLDTLVEEYCDMHVCVRMNTCFINTGYLKLRPASIRARLQFD
jgi:hypothetical protein